MPKLNEEKDTGVTVGGKPAGGWDDVVRRKQENEDNAGGEGTIFNFFLMDGESATVQFLNDEPHCFDAHQIKTKKGKWQTKPCQLAKQKYCLMCDEGVTQTWRAGFKVLDYRGRWDKEKKAFKYDGPMEKLWLVSNTLAVQIKGQVDKRRKPLSKLVFDITRSGSGAKDTSYNLEMAFDAEGENRLVPMEWESEYESVDKLCEAPTDAELEKLGFGSE